MGKKGNGKMPERLGREFFARDGITVAKELLGKTLVHETEAGTVRGIITEVESYMGESDKGSHTYGGKRTERTEPMYHKGGTSYVYLIYGMYSCMNIAAMTEGIPQAVLLRSVVPADGESRQCMINLRLAELNKRQMKKEKPLYTPTEGIAVSRKQIQAGKRIGIDYAEEAADYLWRFFISAGNDLSEGEASI